MTVNNTQHWKAVLTGPGTSLEDAVCIIEKGGMRIAIIVDDAGCLLGTLTDGDIRRALIKHTPMNVTVDTIMCTTPTVAHVSWNRARMLAAMESKQLLHLPVLDDQGRVIGLEMLHGVADLPKIDNPVFLMAGGFGSRLKPLTHNCPKPMLKLGDKPILERILESFISYGFHRFYISTHYLPEVIRGHFEDGTRWGVEIQYTHEQEPLGTGGALGLLPHEEIDLPLVVMNGDLLTTLNFKDLLDFHNGQGGVATMCVREYEHRIPYGVIQSRENKVRSMVEKPVHKCFVNAGVYVLSPELLKRVAPGERIDLPDLLEQSIAQAEDVTAFPLHEYWLDIGRMDDFQRAQSLIDDMFSE